MLVSKLLDKTSYDSPSAQRALLEEICLGRWNESVEDWYRRRGPSLDIPSTAPSPDLDRVSPTVPLRHSIRDFNLTSFQRAQVFAERKRRQQEEQHFAARWGIPASYFDQVPKDTMPEAMHVDGGVNVGGDHNSAPSSPNVPSPRSKQRRLDELQAGRDAAIASAGEQWQKFLVDNMANFGKGQIEIESRTMQIESRTKKIEAHQEKQDTRIANLEEQIKNIVAGTTAAGSSGGSDGGGSTHGGASGFNWKRERITFTPTFVEVKGWVQNWNCPNARSQQMLGQQDSERLVANIKGMLSDTQRGLIDVEATERANSGRFKYGSIKLKFKTGTPSDELWNVQKLLKCIQTPTAQRVAGPPGLNVQSQQLPAPETFKTGLAVDIPIERLKFGVESAPWKVGHIKAVGRFVGIFQPQVQGGPVTLRGETGPPKSYMWTVPPSTDRRALQIAEYSDRTFRWTVFQSTWEIMMNSYGVTTTYDQFQQIINR